MSKTKTVAVDAELFDLLKLVFSDWKRVAIDEGGGLAPERERLRKKVELRLSRIPGSGAQFKSRLA
jgi:hypothetical protein